MRNIQGSIISMLKEHSVRKYLAVAVCMIAIATAFAVFWSLRISGLTLASEDPTCRMQEHTHTDACYDWVATVTDGTEVLESTDETETTEAVEITETAETEESTDEASTESETAEAYESASVEEDTSIAEETEADAVTEGTETGTESVMETSAEDATEEITEELTEEETEAPQPGDTKVVDGVTYVYELVCGFEEHVHTDECYESDAAEDSESKDADADETDETSLEGWNARVATLSLDEDYGISVVSDGEEEEESNTLTSTNSNDTYYFADKVSLSDAYADIASDYVIYTMIGEDYYILTGEGNLVKCTNTGTNSDGTLWVNTTSTYFENMRWNLSGTLDSDIYASTIYNSATGQYLAASKTETTTNASWDSNGSMAQCRYHNRQQQRFKAAPLRICRTNQIISGATGREHLSPPLF